MLALGAVAPAWPPLSIVAYPGRTSFRLSRGCELEDSIHRLSDSEEEPGWGVTILVFEDGWKNLDMACYVLELPFFFGWGCELNWEIKHG